MRKQLDSSRRNALQVGLHGIRLVIPCASLMVGIVLVSPVPALAQATPSNAPPTVGMHATSPLAGGTTRPAGVPLGATEIATFGVSPVEPAQSTTSCAGSDSAGSSASPFDGGGLSANAPLSCADSQTPSSPLLSPSAVGRVGIPLGATELGGTGISPLAPAARPNLSNSTSSTTGPGNP
jgi:hypothetical protein